MTSIEDEGSAQGVEPDETFSVLGNVTRMETLQALWEAYPDEDTATFSELYDAVDLSGSSNFRYHLDQLVGRFVLETPDGYRLSTTGLDVGQSVIAGTLSEERSLTPKPVDLACPICEGPGQATYDGTYLTCLCRDCDGIWSRENGPGYPPASSSPPPGWPAGRPMSWSRR